MGHHNMNECTLTIHLVVTINNIYWQMNKLLRIINNNIICYFTLPYYAVLYVGLRTILPDFIIL